MTDRLHFILNHRKIDTCAHPGVTVLDYLRQSERLTGTKEGSREGGCGACTLLVGELAGETITYQPILSCLFPVGELAGKHLVTIEGLNQDRLSPIQQALVDWGATQCGFCTPGLVMSLTGYLLASPTAIDLEAVKTALHNNLCRYTGYGAIKRAALSLARSLGNRIEPNLENWIAIGIVPEYFRDLPDRLRQLPPTVLANDITSPEFVIAGGTDVYVQHGDRRLFRNKYVKIVF
jgi:xanthine dehydrogenase small subunit